MHDYSTLLLAEALFTLQNAAQRVPLSIILALVCVFLASLGGLLAGIAVKRRVDRIAPPTDDRDDPYDDDED